MKPIDGEFTVKGCISLARIVIYDVDENGYVWIVNGGGRLKVGASNNYEAVRSTRFDYKQWAMIKDDSRKAATSATTTTTTTTTVIKKVGIGSVVLDGRIPRDNVRQRN